MLFGYTVFMDRNEKHKEQVRARNRAWYRAARALIKTHQDEFDTLYLDEATKEGVSPHGSRDS